MSLTIQSTARPKEPDHTFIISHAGGYVDHRVSLHPDGRWHLETHHANPDENGNDPYEWEPRKSFDTAREAFLWVGENEIGIEETASRWFREVPTTDEEAKEALKAGKSSELYRPMIGVFMVRRLQGHSVLDAYEAALLAGVGK